MGLGNHQGVSVADGADVEKGQYGLVLVEFDHRNLAGHHLAENATVHRHSLSELGHLVMTRLIHRPSLGPHTNTRTATPASQAVSEKFRQNKYLSGSIRAQSAMSIFDVGGKCIHFFTVAAGLATFLDPKHPLK